MALSFISIITIFASQLVWKRSALGTVSKNDYNYKDSILFSLACSVKSKSAYHIDIKEMATV